MPTYTYLCPECGHRFNLVHSIMDESEKYCPECGHQSDRQMGGGSSIKTNSSTSTSSNIAAPPPPTGCFT